MTDKHAEAQDFKSSMAKSLIDWHFKVEPRLSVVFRIISTNEGAPNEPIKLLEVNDATVSTGSVVPFGFAKSNDLPFPTVIAEVTPQELERIDKGEIPLPEGWSLQHADKFQRPVSAE